MPKAKKLPEGVGTQKLEIPVPLTEVDKASILDEMTNYQSQVDEVSKELAQMRSDHKDKEAAVQKRRDDISEKLENIFTVARSGHVVKETEVVVRKNFTKSPPMKEFVDPATHEVLHSLPMAEGDYQIQTLEWVEGEPILPKDEPEEDDDDLPI